MDETGLNWADLKLFLAVARAGGLSAAARNTGVSAPTLGRRMHALEADLARQLFVRRADGYGLTAIGREFMAYAEDVETSVTRAERWRDQGTAARPVRVSAGTWMTGFLAHHISRLARADDRFRIALLADDRRLEINRREADIGLRNARPTEAWLAGRSIGDVAFAPYMRRGTEAGDRWIGSLARTPSAEWVRQLGKPTIVVEANSPGVVLELARQGAGKAVLPCFVGDADSSLVRAGERIDSLTHAGWMVLHHDDRHDRSIRQVARRITALLRDNRDLFSGDPPDIGIGRRPD